MLLADSVPTGSEVVARSSPSCGRRKRRSVVSVGPVLLCSRIQERNEARETSSKMTSRELCHLQLATAASEVASPGLLFIYELLPECWGWLGGRARKERRF